MSSIDFQPGDLIVDEVEVRHGVVLDTAYCPVGGGWVRALFDDGRIRRIRHSDTRVVAITPTGDNGDRSGT